MKKSILFLATLLCTLAASAKVINAVPAGDISWYLSQAEAGDVIEMADGTYDEAYEITFSVENLTIKAAEGAKPVIALTGEWTSLKLAATTTFEGITFDGGGIAYYPITTEGENTSIFTFNNCEFKNYQYYAISNNNASAQTNVNSVVVNNCIFHDGGSAIYMNEEAACAKLTVQNTTIYNFAGVDKYKAAIHIAEVTSDATFATQTLIDHVTIYNIQTSSSVGAITIVNASETTISNSIIASPEQKHIDSYNVPAEATIQNCLVYNQHLDEVWTSTITNADPMFVDAANGNFQLYAESPAVGAGTGGSNLGDPRWGVKAGIQPGEGKLKDAVEAAQPGDVIVLGDETYEVSSSISCNVEGLTIKAAEGTKPIISFTGTWSSLKLSATTTFEGIIFDGGNVVNYPITTEGENTGVFTFNNCEFKDYLYYAISNNNATAKTNINSVIVNGCTFHDGGSAIYMNKQAACANLTVQNSTIYNIAGTDIYKAAIHIAEVENNATFATQTLIDHVTIYNVQTSASEGAITIANASKTTISNSIIASPEQKHIDSYNVPAEATIQNCLVYNQHLDEVWKTTITNADPMFVDAANYDFMLSANSPAVGAGTDGSNLGDQRWGVSAMLKGKVINITPGQAKLNNAVGSASICDTIVLADGTYEEPWTFSLDKEGLVIMAAENAKPEIVISGEYANLEISATTTFDGITFNGNDVAKYIISIQDSTSMNTNLVLLNCEFKNWTQWAVSNQYSKNVSVDSVIIDNCLFHDGGGSAIYFSQNAPEGTHACNYIKMTNSSIYNVVSTQYAGIIHVSSNGEATGEQNEIIIDHITMYNLDGADLGIIAVRKSSDLTISNTIIANPAAGERASYVYGGVAEKVIYYNVSQDGDLTYTNCLTDDPLFVDATNNNFKLKGNSPAIGKATDGTNLGDPRWGVEAIVIGEGDNSAALATEGEVFVQVNREFIAGNLYTIALPFTLNDVASVFGQGTVLYEYDKLIKQNDEVVLHFKEVNTISAGKPYLLKPAQNVDGFVVNNVTLSNSTQTLSFTVGTTTIAMEPILSVTTGQTTDGKYWLAADKYLYNSTNTLPSLRALFIITTQNGIAPRARVALGENEATGLDNITTNEKATKAIVNGQLVIIRGGEMYNVQGQKL